MPTYRWVLIGMLTAGIGGALAPWGSMNWMYRDLEPEPPEVLRSLTALGDMLAGVCGGIASLGRGKRSKHKDFPGGLAALGLGLGVIALVIPGVLFFPFLLVVAPLQGLAALLGGFAALAALWIALSFAGIRNSSDLAVPFRGAAATPLGKSGLLAMLMSFVLPRLPYLQDSLEVGVLSNLIFDGGLVLCGASLLQRYVVRPGTIGSHGVEPTDAMDSR